MTRPVGFDQEDLATEAASAASVEVVTKQVEVVAKRDSVSRLAKQAAKRGCTPKRLASLQVKFRILVSLVQVISQLGVVFSIP